MHGYEIEDVLKAVAFTQHPTLTVKVGYDDVVVTTYDHAFIYDDTTIQPWLQLVDPTLPKEYTNGRKWRLSQYMTPSEVVGTAFAAYKAWLEHEMMESFTYKGVQVFSPHLDIEARVEVASNPDNYEYRS